MEPADSTLSVVRTYHRSWSSKNFTEAIRLLAADIKIEVPINTYTTPESFAEALTRFGSMVNRVFLLGEFAREKEAVLLYDMDIDTLGTLRVAEHFKVVNGKIVGIRQIHDTAALRAAGFMRSG
ncbi:MAG: nuclear transport factor 2 family protein [Gammaproteobacteria bacterium]|nr:nuclear transport factor 2 family protein [Gammaproteobacteria bacterium]